MVPADGWHQAARTRVACRSQHERGTGLFATSGHAGLDVSQDGAGCNTISGSFEITNVVISSAGILQQLDMTLNSVAKTELPLRGRFAYDASGAPISFDSGRNRCSYTVPRACTADALLLITAAVLQLSKLAAQLGHMQIARIEATR